MGFWKEERGITLVELMIGIAILAVVSAGIAYAFQGMVKSQNYNYQYGANVQDGGTVMQLIADEVRNAVSIESPIRGGTGSAVFRYTYRDQEEDKTAKIYVEKNVVVIEKDQKKRTLAQGRVWPSSDEFSEDGSLYFRFDEKSSRKALLDITLKMENVQKKNQAVNPSLEFQTKVSTLNSI